MLEIKVTIDAPGLSSAIDKLAQSIAGLTVESVLPESGTLETPGVIPYPSPVPDQAPVTPKPAVVEQAPTPVVEQAPATQPAAAPAPVPQPIPAPQPQAEIDLNALSVAGAGLISQSPDNMKKIMDLLAAYGVKAITQLDKSQYPTFADELRKLGADI